MKGFARTFCGLTAAVVVLFVPATGQTGTSSSTAAAPSTSVKTFSAAGTVADTTGLKGPCAFAVAGSRNAAGVLAGHGALSGIENELATPASACGAIGSVRFDVVGGTVTATAAQLVVQVTSSDAPGAPVGTVGAVQIDSATQRIDFLIGAFCCGSGQGATSTAGTLTRRSNVQVATAVGATDIVEIVGAGTQVTVDRRFGPCTVAVAATRTGNAKGARIVSGGGSYQAMGGTGVHASIPADPGQSACNGGVGSFSFNALAPVETDGASEAALRFAVTSTSVPGKTPVGAVGSADLIEPGSRIHLGVGQQSGAWADHDFFSFVERRAAVTVATRTLAAPVTPASAGVTTFSATGTAIDTYGTKGPCSLAVAGGTIGSTIVAGGAIVGIENDSADPRSICGAIGSVQFDVTATTFTGTSSATLTVRVTRSDTGGTPVGTTGTITIDNATDYVAFSIGGFCCAFGPGHSFFSTYDERATVSISTLAGATALDHYAAAGASNTIDHRYGPCTIATAGTRVFLASGQSQIDGSGSFEAVGGLQPGQDPGNSSCNGGPGAFTLAVEPPLATDGATHVFALARATESNDPIGAAVGTPGAFRLRISNSEIGIGLGTHSGEFAEHDAFQFVFRRAGVRIGHWTIDADTDGVPDATDVCVGVSDAEQLDTDGDASGDECDATPGSTPGAKVNGGGWFGEEKSHFEVNVDTKKGPKGQLKFSNRTDGVDFRSDTITSIVRVGTRAIVRGTGNDGSQNVTFRAELDDRGEPGSSDTFMLDLSSGYSVSGTLDGGNIQVR